MAKEKLPKLSRQDILNSIPTRNQAITVERGKKGEVLLILPIKKTWWINFLSKILLAPKKKIITLDEIGTKVWEMCDGKTSVESIIQKLCLDLKMNRKEVETSLLFYLRQLASRSIVGLQVIKK